MSAVFDPAEVVFNVTVVTSVIVAPSLPSRTTSVSVSETASLRWKPAPVLS